MILIRIMICLRGCLLFISREIGRWLLLKTILSVKILGLLEEPYQLTRRIGRLEIWLILLLKTMFLLKTWPTLVAMQSTSATQFFNPSLPTYVEEQVSQTTSSHVTLE